MFKYNSLSDLKDGTLTTPLRKEGEYIICQNENGIIVNKLISDFDFAKKPEEREFILGTDLTSKMEEDLLQENPEFESVVQPESESETEPAPEPEPVVQVESIVQEHTKAVLDKRLPINISGKNIKVSIETQRIP
jgi:hypothetical protein